MGMFSEVAAERFAKVLYDIIKQAKATGNAVVIEFADRVIYPAYWHECGNAFREAVPNAEIHSDDRGLTILVERGTIDRCPVVKWYHIRF